MSLDTQAIEHFLHGQIECWNSGDKAGFLAHYRKIAPNGLTIEYVGYPLRDPWLVLEEMWEQQQANIRIEVAKAIINGNEAACHHLNNRLSGEPGTETIEVYKFAEGKMSVRYFIAR